MAFFHKALHALEDNLLLSRGASPLPSSTIRTIDKILLGHVQYILWSTDPDRGFFLLEENK